METVNKITQEQLSTILEHQKELSKIISNIGILECQKHSLLHQVAEVNKVSEEFKTQLQNEYGVVNINLEDGSYTPVEEPVTTEVE